MKEYKVIYRATVKPYLDELGQYISEQTTPEFADRYLEKLRREVESLSIMAGMLPPSKYLMPLRYHKDAKTMTIGKRKLTVIFHIEGEYVIVDKILPSCMITY